MVFDQPGVMRASFALVIMSLFAIEGTPFSFQVYRQGIRADGARPIFLAPRSPRFSKSDVLPGTPKLLAPRKRRAPTMSTADVCIGDVPTPGWVRVAHRNLKRIKVGDSLPDVPVSRLDDNGAIESFSVRDLFGERKGVLVGVPGAFTPTCSRMHLPEYVNQSDALMAKGAEVVVFVAVNDVYVMRAWEDSQRTKGKVLMLSEGNGDLAAALGMMIDLTHQGMGLRCKRFVCVVEGGKVTHTRVGDQVGPVSASSVLRVLEKDARPRKGGLFEKLLGREVEAAAKEAAEESGEFQRA